ncbi:hypothetical protein [Mesobacillus foraminis]|uniref:Uncharacterized protein n=1 Tax=Mesobacillus foraminis TaxID=279826 RepID=A0A4R2BN79_9BACI|nr:hypothetical protein [Mesobacillus foraminis]TCN28073.1 hypothetical protein EV146_101404 [Mesobacillus foraminis]
MKKWVINMVVIIIIVGAGASVYGYFSDKRELPSTSTTQTLMASAEFGYVEATYKNSLS